MDAFVEFTLGPKSTVGSNTTARVEHLVKADHPIRRILVKISNIGCAGSIFLFGPGFSVSPQGFIEPAKACFDVGVRDSVHGSTSYG